MFKQNGGTRGAPYVVFNDNAGYKSTYNMTSGLIASANTYFVGLEDALGSVEGPVRHRRGDGHALRQPGHPAHGRL